MIDLSLADEVAHSKVVDVVTDIERYGGKRWQQLTAWQQLDNSIFIVWRQIGTVWTHLVVSLFDGCCCLGSYNGKRTQLMGPLCL